MILLIMIPTDQEHMKCGYLHLVKEKDLIKVQEKDYVLILILMI